MGQEEQHIEFKGQIARYLAGEMTVSEKEQFEHLLEADKELLSQFSEFRKIWEGVDQLAARTKYDMDSEWSVLAGKIDFSEEKQYSPARSIRMTVMRIAAILVIGLLVVAGWYGGRELLMFDRVAVETGTQLIELPDGTKVTLNSGSTVKYTRNESLNYRKVKLNGEAFFEVTRDTTRPFIIDAGPAQIKVLGTSFNVNAYPENKSVEVTVSAGLVAMSSLHEDGNQIVLNQGNTGIYSKNRDELKLIVSGRVNANAWLTQKLEFTDTPLEEVIEVLNHTYQSEIVIQDPSLANYTITVSFNKQELDAVLKVLASTLDLKIEKDGEQIIIESE